MATARQQKWTRESYLAFERASEQKHEFINGDVYAMAGASRSHNRVVTKVISRLDAQLTGSPCEVFPNDMRVSINQSGEYVYPDVIVVCGEAEFEDTNFDILLNPTLIVEVLSSSTQVYDRGKKFADYRTIASLREYVLIDQDQPVVERFSLLPDGVWTFADARGLEATIQLPSINCVLSLVEVYANIQFTSQPPRDGLIT